MPMAAKAMPDKAAILASRLSLDGSVLAIVVQPMRCSEPTVDPAAVPAKSSCADDSCGQNSGFGSRPRQNQSPDNDDHTQHHCDVSGDAVSPHPDSSTGERPMS